MRNHEQLNPVVARFELEWREGKRPKISEVLTTVGDLDRETILPELISIDIDYRVSIGESVYPKDYQPLGSDAAEIASEKLGDSMSFQSDKDLGVTALDSRTDEPNDATIELHEPNVRAEGRNGTPRFIGPYELLEQIGEGGMGTVWLAEQHEPVRRRVALKVIRGEIDSQPAIARFEAERQAIALMEHQNIAKILDAGTTKSGNPYFAMELVDGVPLNEYCDRRKLGIRERLELMIPVCRAIHHAHQKGIIHRDLKHSNVLVTQYDGQPVPKVIDFGLAKAFETQNKLTEETIFTEYGQVVGTLQYMSPEQAELDCVDIDTRADIYSLGVMVYKLLTGTTPLNTEGQAAKTLLEIMQLIREQEPQKPSDRLVSFEPKRLKQIADRHNVKPEKLIHQLKSDVDWIVMKAIEKDRDRRYESANGLALDLDRFLNNEEVRACPPSTIYRVEKFYKRNKKLVASLSAIAAVLLLGIIGTCYGLYCALIEQNKAKLEADNAVEARNEAQTARSLAETRLQAIRIKSAYSDWQLGNVESAWQGFSSLDPGDLSWESRFLQTELSSSRNVMYGHALALTSIDASLDGRFVATASQDNSVIVRDAKTKKILHTVLTQDLPYCVRFSPNSKRIACVDRANLVTVFDSETGKNITVLGPFKEDITALAFLDQGSKLVTGTGSLDLAGIKDNFKQLAEVQPLIRILNLDDGSVLAELGGHTKTIASVDCSSDGKFIVSGGEDSTIRIWQKGEDGFALDNTLKAHFPGVLEVSISPDDKSFASCGKDGTIRLWTLQSGQPIRTMVGHLDDVNGVCFSSDGEQIVSASSDLTARIWNVEGENLRVYQGHFEEINGVCFSADDAEFFTASEDNTARFHRSAAKTSTLEIRHHRDSVWQTVFSPDGKRLITAGEDGMLSIIDPQTGHLVADKIQLEQSVLCVDHSPDSDIFVSGGADGKVRVWDSHTGAPLTSFDAHDGFIWDIAFSADGQLMATASSDNTFKVWTTSDWAEVRQVQAHDGELGSVRFSDDGKHLATAGDDAKVKLWDASTYELVFEFEGHRKGVWRAIFSPTNPNLIASSGYDGEILIWDLEKQKLRMPPIKAHKNQIAGLAFTADGTRILSASDDQTIKIWDVKTGSELFVLRDKDNSAIVAASFSKDGTRLATGNQDGWVTIRSANKIADEYLPFLPMDSIQLALDVSAAVLLECETNEDFLAQLDLAEKCCRHFPSYVTYSAKGIAQYRLGRFDESITSLVEARRLEPLMYGAPDLPPYIEGFLALAYSKQGQLGKSRQIWAVFLEKSGAKIWNDNEPIPELIAEIEAEYERKSKLLSN